PQVLRLLNLSLAPRPPPRAPPAPPGFPALRELSLAGAGGGVGAALLRRLLGGSPRLRHLDLRDCARLPPPALPPLPCPELEQLYLGLRRGGEQVPGGPAGAAAVAWKWRRSLRELDLAGRAFGQQDLARALAAFGPRSPLRSLDLAATKVTPGALSGLLACPDLTYLNLSSCRHLPRGTKRPHRGRQEVQRCLRLLADLPHGAPPEGRGEEGRKEESLGEEEPDEELEEEPPQWGTPQ
ncbi:F-box/LRR-repeat protein 6, partial [Chroicocephalus ridibundus]|uniref:F-box/LRR-repeat protein 6 n=1 Tax=Chroicocephalus ridibundus TaxID=1192867 RepID=UPI002FDED810